MGSLQGSSNWESQESPAPQLPGPESLVEMGEPRLSPGSLHPTQTPPPRPPGVFFFVLKFENHPIRRTDCTRGPRHRAFSDSLGKIYPKRKTSAAPVPGKLTFQKPPGTPTYRCVSSPVGVPEWLEEHSAADALLGLVGDRICIGCTLCVLFLYLVYDFKVYGILAS